MDSHHSIQFSQPRFSVRYQLAGKEEEARAKAETLCLDQTVELPDECVPDRPIRTNVLGRVENFQKLGGHQYEALLSFPSELLGGEFNQILSVAFGIASLKPGIRVARLELPNEVADLWHGPRLGRGGLRDRLGVQNRPLICGVLKPVGLTPQQLADLAYEFAMGGLDLIKDDQGLVDQIFCPFDERITRCASAVFRANSETGRHCLYFPHVTGSAKRIYKRSLFAQEAGAGGVLVCPGLSGFDSIRLLAGDANLDLPVMSHPSLLGSFMVNQESGIAPSVLFGQIPRLAGADISIYPTYGGSFPITVHDCRQIAKETSLPWGGLNSMFPTAAGRIHLDQVRELISLYGNDFVFVVGSEVVQPGKKVVESCRDFVEQVTRLAQ